jgi:hypothetical protein
MSEIGAKAEVQSFSLKVRNVLEVAVQVAAGCELVDNPYGC